MSAASGTAKVDGAAFRAAMADLPAAVSIVTTTAADGTPRGATVVYHRRTLLPAPAP